MKFARRQKLPYTLRSTKWKRHLKLANHPQSHLHQSTRSSSHQKTFLWLLKVENFHLANLGLTKVLECTGGLTYCLHLPPSMHQHPVFHIDRLSSWSGNNINDVNPSPPPPDQIDNQLKYEVESILDSRHKYRNQHQYLVKWKGYDTGHNSWKPATNLSHSAELVDKFHSAHPLAPHCLSAFIFATLSWQSCITFTDSTPCPQ